MSAPVAIVYGCARPSCGYRVLASTLPTHYTRCPVCSGRWIPNPPKPLCPDSKSTKQPRKV